MLILSISSQEVGSCEERGESECEWILENDLIFVFVIVVFITNVYIIYYTKLQIKYICNSNTFLNTKSWKLPILENTELEAKFKIFWKNKKSHRTFFL